MLCENILKISYHGSFKRQGKVERFGLGYVIY